MERIIFSKKNVMFATKKFLSGFVILIALTGSCVQAFASFDTYLTDIEDNANGRKISQTQKKEVKDAFDTGNYNEKKDPTQIKASHTFFNNNRENLKKEWATNTRTNWHQTTETTQEKVEDRRYKEKFRIDKSRENIDHHAHHIIPQSYGGPNLWWNLFPLTKTQHQKVHRAGGPCIKLFPKRPGRPVED